MNISNGHKLPQIVNYILVVLDSQFVMVFEQYKMLHQLS